MNSLSPEVLLTNNKPICVTLTAIFAHDIFQNQNERIDRSSKLTCPRAQTVKSRIKETESKKL